MLVRHALQYWLAVLGGVTAAVSLANLAAKLLRIEWSGIIKDFFVFYADLVRPLTDALKSLGLPGFLADVLIVYAIFLAMSLRVLFATTPVGTFIPYYGEDDGEDIWERLGLDLDTFARIRWFFHCLAKSLTLWPYRTLVSRFNELRSSQKSLEEFREDPYGSQRDDPRDNPAIRDPVGFIQLEASMRASTAKHARYNFWFPLVQVAMIPIAMAVFFTINAYN